MLFSFGYGKTILHYDVPDENLLGILMPNETPAARTGEAEVKRALQNPIGTKRLKDIVHPGEKIAVDSAKHAVRDGGVIVWLAVAGEGLGEDTFEKWMLGHEKSHDMIEHINREFELGGHKAAAIAMVLEKCRVLFVSSLDADFVRKIHLEPFATLDEAMEEAFRAMGKAAKVLAMPYGGSTLPVLSDIR